MGPPYVGAHQPLRRERKNPGHTVYDDPNCFRGYEAAGKMMFDSLGFYVPAISTEGGPVVGWGDDLRYNKLVPDQQMAMQPRLCSACRTTRCRSGTLPCAPG